MSGVYVPPHRQGLFIPSEHVIRVRNIAQDGTLTISGRGVAEPLPLADASVDIIYGLHGFHCMESFDRVHAEMMRLLRPGGRLVWACSIARDLDDGARVVAGAMRAAGFVDVKIDVTRLQGAARWTPVVGVKAR